MRGSSDDTEGQSVVTCCLQQKSWTLGTEGTYVGVYPKVMNWRAVG